MTHLNANALKRMQVGVEPDTTRASTPLEAIQALRKKEMDKQAQPQPTSQQPPQAPREYVTVDGFRVPKDFFTCVTMCIIKLNDEGVNNTLKAFGFAMQDADGKVIFPQPFPQAFTQPAPAPKKTKKKKK